MERHGSVRPASRLVRGWLAAIVSEGKGRAGQAWSTGHSRVARSRSTQSLLPAHPGAAARIADTRKIPAMMHPNRSGYQPAISATRTIVGTLNVHRSPPLRSSAQARM